MEKLNLKRVYVYLVMIVLMLPFVLFFVMPTTETTENKKLSEFPTLFEGEDFNVDYMKDLSTYFEERFAFRTYLVDINSKIRAGIFKTTPEDDIIVGKNGWLYYSATLDDYRGADLSTERELFAMAKNIRLMQDFVENHGAKFVFTIAPNKNTLYPENMPMQYDCVLSNEHDAYRLKPYLDMFGVNYVNLFSGFASKKETLYLKSDSHWNKKGAVLAYNLILDKAGKQHERYDDVIPELVNGAVVGDLASMIYPINTGKEADFDFNKYYSYIFRYCSNETTDLTLDDVINETLDLVIVDVIDDGKDTSGFDMPQIEDVTLSEIVTTTDGADGSLLMFRDSFGNSLIDLFSEEFAVSYFSKQEPYDLSKMDRFDSDIVVLEKVERHIKSLAKVAPLMVADERADFEEARSKEAVINKPLDEEISIDISTENDLLKISGLMPEKMVATDTEVTLLVSDGEAIKAYDAFLTGENGFCIYLDSDEDVSVKALIKNGSDLFAIGALDDDQEIKNTYDGLILAEKKKLEEEQALAEQLKKEEQALAEKKAREEKELAEKKAKEEEERLAKEAEEAAKEAKKKEGNGGKTVVSKVFYEDCGADSGYYEIVWSDGSVTYEDVY